MDEEPKSMGDILGLQKSSNSVIKILSALSNVNKLSELTKLNPSSPQERLAWWIRIADLYHKSGNRPKAKKAVAILRRVAKENEIQVPNCQFLIFYKT